MPVVSMPLALATSFKVCQPVACVQRMARAAVRLAVLLLLASVRWPSAWIRKSGSVDPSSGEVDARPTITSPVPLTARAAPLVGPGASPKLTGPAEPVQETGRSGLLKVADCEAPTTTGPEVLTP